MQLATIQEFQPETCVISTNQYNSSQPLANGVSVSVFNDINGLKAPWDALCKRCDTTIYQSHYWAELCLKTLEKHDDIQPHIITGWVDQRLVFVFPTLIEGGFSKTLRWIGGSHANICMGLFDPQYADQFDTRSIEHVLSLATQDINGIGTIALENQPAHWGTTINPMATIFQQASVNNSFHLSLDGDFDAVLARGNAKRKRKKFRQQCRIAEEAGGYELIVADQAEAVLQEFSKQKSARFAKLGIADVFAERSAQLFLQHLGSSVTGASHDQFKLFALKIDGRVRAVFGGGLQNGHLSGYFSSISDDDLAHISPGEMLLYLMVEHCCGTNVQSLDLGQGDERYKRSWCDEEIELNDVILPLNKASIPIVSLRKKINRFKHQIRSQPVLWKQVKKIRKMVR